MTEVIRSDKKCIVFRTLNKDKDYTFRQFFLDSYEYDVWHPGGDVLTRLWKFSEDQKNVLWRKDSIDNGTSDHRWRKMMDFDQNDDRAVLLTLLINWFMEVGLGL